MSDEQTPITLTETDHQSIADKLFEKAEQRQQSTDKDDDKKTSTEVKLTDDDRKGIASYLKQLDKEEAEAAAKDEEDKKKQKQEARDNVPQAPSNLFERSLFSIGGGKRAAS